MLTKFKAGIVGAGHISRFHIEAIRRSGVAEIVGVADVDRARAESVRAQFGLPMTGASVDELIAAGADVVHILTPPHSHAPLAIRALDAGCHVYVEKPLAMTEAECASVAAAAERAGRSVCAGHSLLRDPFVARGLDLVARGAIGEVLSVDYVRCQGYPPYAGGPRPVHYRDGGYPFRDLGVHALYVIEAFLGPITDVSPSFDSTGRDPNLHFDEWRVLVRCDQGTAQIHMSWNIRPQQNRITVQGTRGVITIDLFGMSVSVKRQGRMPEHATRISNAVHEGTAIATQAAANVVRVLRKRIRQYHGLQTLVADFYGALAEGRPSPVPPEHARRVVAWTDAVASAADRRKAQELARPERRQATVLVTGGAGFIGSHLVARLLAEGERVRLLLRRAPAAALAEHPLVEIVRGDLGDPDAVAGAMTGVKTVFHVAAAMRGSAAEFDCATVLGTRHVVDEALRQGVQRLVYVSSLAVLDAAGGRPGDVLTEASPLEPHPRLRGQYSRAKCEAEAYVVQAIRERGLPAVILRPAEVIGSTPLMTSGVAQRVGARFVILGNGRLNVPLVHVEDVIDAMILARNSSAAVGSILHIVDRAEVTQADLVEHYMKVHGERRPITRVPMPIVMALAFGVQCLARVLRRDAPLSVYRLRSATADRRFDPTRAEQMLGWTPRIGVDAGLAAMRAGASDSSQASSAAVLPDREPVAV